MPFSYRNLSWHFLLFAIVFFLVIVPIGMLVAPAMKGLLPSIWEVDQAVPTDLDKTLMEAIRDGEREKVRNLLGKGAKANGVDESGDTALMRACLLGSVEIVRILLDNHADVNARGKDGTAPLVRAVHDVQKLQVLLDRGAQVDDFIMVAAASVSGCRPALEMLMRHGGRPQGDKPGFTPLMAAAIHGDLNAVQYLLDRGADPRTRTKTGFTALIGGSLSGNARVVALLLDRGADPNAVSELERGILQTPAGVAASLGFADCLKLLMAAGADVNVQGGPFKHSALLGAATTPSKETIQLLLGKANLSVADINGLTPLDWASRSGKTEIVRLLQEVGAERSHPLPQPPQPTQTLVKADPDSLKKAVLASLPALQQSEQTITRTRNCVSCHQHSLVSMTVALARQHGIPVDETIARQERAHILQDTGLRLRSLLLGTGIDPTLSVHLLVGFAAENEPSNRITDALVHYLVLRQRKEGYWQQENYRPPDEASHFQFTALAVRGLQVYRSQGRGTEIAGRIELARQWLQNEKPVDTTDRSFQLLGMKWSGADPKSIQTARAALIAEQRPDGGWAQLPTLPSDAYATGLALYALNQGGELPIQDPIYQQGVEFLLSTQGEDGSWFVPSRSFPIVEYSKSGFPHGKSQFISASATCWATMALTLAIP